MEANLLVIIGVLVLAITGFISLAVTMLAVSESLEKKNPSLFRGFSNTRRPGNPLPHGECYDQCMEALHWDPAGASPCTSACGL